MGWGPLGSVGSFREVGVWVGVCHKGSFKEVGVLRGLLVRPLLHSDPKPNFCLFLLQAFLLATMGTFNRAWSPKGNAPPIPVTKY